MAAEELPGFVPRVSACRRCFSSGADEAVFDAMLERWRANVLNRFLAELPSQATPITLSMLRSYSGVARIPLAVELLQY